MDTPRPDVANLFSLTTKRVTDLVLEQSREAFRRRGIELDAKMTSIITLTQQHQATSQVTSTFLAARTGLSRQLVESRLRRLVADGYLEEAKDPDDLRRRVYTISETKREDVGRVLSTIRDFESVYLALWEEMGVDVHRGLKQLEARLEAKSVIARLADLDPGKPEPTQGDDR